MANVPPSTMRSRLEKMSVEEALDKETMKVYVYKGKTYTVPELSKMTGVPYNTMRRRLTKMTVEEA